jgi:hypothetical protein
MSRHMVHRSNRLTLISKNVMPRRNFSQECRLWFKISSPLRQGAQSHVLPSVLRKLLLDINFKARMPRKNICQYCRLWLNNKLTIAARSAVSCPATCLMRAAVGH